MIYFIGWGLGYFSFLFWRIVESRFFLFLTIIFFAAVSFFRCSGTDTASYESIISSFLEETDNIFISIEPGFYFLSRLILFISDSEVWGVRIFSLVFILFLLQYLRRADKIEIMFLFLYFLPAFGYTYSMNIVRAGLGSSLILLAWQNLRRNRLVDFYSLSIISVFFHYSMFFPTAIMYLLEFRFGKIRNWIFLFVFILLIFIIIYNRWDWFSAKIALYSEMESPYIFSGLSRFIQIFIIIFFFCFSRVDFVSRIFAISVLVFAVISQILATFSYSGLRVLDLLAFLTPLILIRFSEKRNTFIGGFFWFGLAVSGFFCIMATYRNFLLESETIDSVTPFLPYRTVFECHNMW